VTLYKCDRCGEEIGRLTPETPLYDEAPKGRCLAEKYSPQNDRPMAELCQSCWSKLEAWLKDESPVPAGSS
jgi:DNA-directed RNA polymerase subunit RPC12/RpoP